MDIAEAKIQNSQLNEGVGGDTSLEININEFNQQNENNGSVYNGCVFNNTLAPVYESNLLDDLLSPIQRLFLTGKYSEGYTLLNSISKSTTYKDFKHEKKLLIAVLESAYYLSQGDFSIGIECIDSLEEALKDDKVLRAWKAIFEVKSGNENGLKDLHSLLSLYPNSPNVLNLSFLSDNRELISTARRNLDEIIQEPPEKGLDDFKGPLVSLCHVLAEQERVFKTLCQQESRVQRGDSLCPQSVSPFEKGSSSSSAPGVSSALLPA